MLEEVCAGTGSNVGDALGADGINRLENLSTFGSCSFSLAADDREITG